MAPAPFGYAPNTAYEMRLTCPRVLLQVLGAIIASAIVLGLKADDRRDDALVGANIYNDLDGNTKTRAFGGMLLRHCNHQHQDCTCF